ncbi:beta-N-acetylhexosaminidase [Pedobacter aquatilis]|uniref:beta-N-acetylhexosaminidase n=1 Tax=Pedobacter aquatilis TaxID=351343 RepID=UPI002930437D|nr:beta-N-acetylhexosaminidase [Pedobacter aquatilis]
MHKFILSFFILFSLFSIVSFAQSLPLNLIPMPAQVHRLKGDLELSQLKAIYYNSDSLKKEAVLLQSILAANGIHLKLRAGPDATGKSLISLLQQPEVSGKIEKAGAYHLQINPSGVKVQSASTAGVFYAVQTLRQLINGKHIPYVLIEDLPAFSWRGYMVDVGRNYQSPELLKQQIELMAAYKLNVFHLHLTEDIAWRLASKSYPQLNAPEYMERNKGMYYTEKEIRELIDFCKARHILFIPEIDMPGHSLAFKKAMKTDMQSDSGLVVVKQILKEFSETYALPYIHIGADEVKITNKKFLPEVIAYLKSLDKQIIGWEPGGNFDDSVIRQLWMDDAGLTSGNDKIRFIDSRHLYLNHMDPFESVVTLFHRQLADTDEGNQIALGATLCLWPDRAVAKQEDAITMNAVYPAMMTFAERSWRGGGYKGWVASLNLNGAQASKDFADFESRLMNHKDRYFKNKNFPYYKQSNLEWSLYGPFENSGDLSKVFEPEDPDFDFTKHAANQTASGATIILRHWWAPKINAVLEHPKENTTWYAVQKIWSAVDTVKQYWIGFNNFSRSQATDSPEAGSWDRHHSAIWLNNTLISPPEWIRGGQKGNLEIPLLDEGYEFREPISLHLKKGWNLVKVKLPIGSFKAANWNNPEKWMFTFVEVQKAAF